MTRAAWEGKQVAGAGVGGGTLTVFPFVSFLILEPFECITYNNKKTHRKLSNYCVHMCRRVIALKVLKRDCDPGRGENKQFT